MYDGTPGQQLPCSATNTCKWCNNYQDAINLDTEKGCSFACSPTPNEPVHAVISTWNQLLERAKTCKLSSPDYEGVEGAQLSNSFILLLILNEPNEALTTTQKSELISRRSKGQIYRVSGTLRDSLEHRLKREC